MFTACHVQPDGDIMKINPFLRPTALALILTAMLAGAALAEIPDTFSNLKVFPNDIGKRELLGAMRDFSTSLGVRCTFCHVQKTPGDFDSIDWASDALEPKKVTRGMMTMVRDLNRELLPAATGGQGARVRCITCHRGIEDPRTLDKVLLEATENDGIEVGIARYRELRAEYYGSGAYDFRPSTLTSVAEALAQNRGELKSAVQFLDLGIEMNPEDVTTYLMKSQILILEGDKEGALDSARKALELDPENEQALEIIEQFSE
jgi:tetratricopeptide (TPR) repeat protein